MADTNEAGDSGDAASQELTFKVKSTGDKTHTVTISEGVTVLELKNKLAGDDFENIPAERQRLIYSGRVMKNDDKLSVYKIKPNNTVHLVKSAASNPTPSSASQSTPAQPAIPSNMAAGTNNDLLSGLTGARFAGMANLPSASMFGADGGMGAPPNPEELARALNDPAVQQTMRAAMDSPEFINMMLQSPYIRQFPGAREVLQSPALRQLLLNPELVRLTSLMSNRYNQGGGSFPAPGATNAPGEGTDGSTGATGTASDSNAGAGAGANTQASPPPFPGFPGLFGAPPSDGSNPPPNPFAALAGQNPSQNPFAALLGGGGGGATPGAGLGAAAGQQPAFGPGNEEAFRSVLESVMRDMGGAGAQGQTPSAPSAPADNRPPEERYEQQLQQLNEMGFYDFDRNVAALRRSGGNVQGAVEFLLGGG